MNILFHSWAYTPNGGGVGAYMSNMARAMAACGHKVVVVTGRADGLPEKETTHNLTVLRQYHARQIGSRLALERVMDAVRNYAIDWIEGADCFGDCARLLNVRNRPPVAIKIHSCSMLKILYESQILRWWQRPMIQLAFLRNWRLVWRERKSILGADMITAPSLRILQELKKQGVRLPQPKAVIPNPVMPTHLPAGVEAPVPTLLMVGRLDIGKGIQYLPGILGGLVREFPGLKLEIAGSDSYARGLGSLKKWLIGKLGNLVGHVKFLGHLDRDELIAAYQRAWVIVIPSRWDTFPTVLLEAMSLGKPVVASPHGGMPEMVKNTLCQTALPESETFTQLIEKLLRDPGHRAKAGESLRQRARKTYCPENIVSRYLGFIDDAMGTKNSCSPEKSAVGDGISNRYS